MGSAFDHNPTITVPSSSTNTALVRWSGTGANTFLDSTIIVGATTMGLAADTDLVTFASGTLTIAGTLAATALTGDGSALTGISAGPTINGATENELVTVANNTANLDAEANLTFDGANLYLINSATSSSSNIMAYSSATSTATPARLILRVGSGNTGDAFATFHNQTGGGAEWALGLDNSDSNKFKLGYGGTVDSNTFFEANGTAATRSIIFHTGNGNNTNHGVLFFDSPNANTGLEDLPNTGAIYGQQAIRTTTIGQIGMNWNDASGGRGYGLNIKGFTYYNHGLSLISWTKSLVTTQAANQGAAIAIMCRRHDGEDNTDTYGSSSNLVRIGANSGGSRFFFTYGGDGYADNSWTTFSDNRLKFNQEVVPYGLNTVMQMQPKIYDKYSGGIEDGVVTLVDEAPRRQIGFVAQEIKALIPEVVADTDENNGWYSLEDGKLMAVVVKAIQELNAKVDALS